LIDEIRGRIVEDLRLAQARIRGERRVAAKVSGTIENRDGKDRAGRRRLDRNPDIAEDQVG